MTQQFLITVQAMCTSDEADLVSGWSGIVAEESLGNISLSTAAEATMLALRGAPATNIRPMTEEEIAVWRAAD